MSKPISIMLPSRKGGVGKTSLTLNLAAMYANSGKRVLIIGLDPQQDITSAYLSSDAIYQKEDHPSLASLLEGSYELKDVIYHTQDYPRYEYKKNIIGKTARKKTGTVYHLDMIPAGIDLDMIDPVLLNNMEEKLASLEDSYDYIFYDMPTAETNVAIAAYQLCNYAIVPVSDQAGFESVRLVTDTIQLSQENGSHIQLLGIVINLFKSQRALQQYNKKLFMETGGDMMYQTVIRDGADLPTSSAFSTPLCSYQERSEVQGDIYDFYLETEERISEEEGN